MNPSRASNAYRRTRRDHATEVAEDYAEAIASIEAASGQCRVKDLADCFGVTHVAVIGVVNRLERDGLAATEPYKPVRLTAAGRRLAERCRARHELVFEFLRSIGVPEAAAAADAEGIEHHVSPETLRVFQACVDRSRDR